MALLDKSFRQLETIQHAKKNQIETFMIERFADLETLAGDEATKDAMEQFHLIFHNFEKQNQAIGGKSWQQMLDQRLVDRLEKYRQAYGYYDVLFLDIDGHVVYTAARASDLGDNVTHGVLKNSPLHKLFVKAQAGKAIQDFEPYAPSAYRHAAFIGIPVLKDGQRLGVVAFQLPTNVINTVMAERAGMGKTGETYLIGKHEGVVSYRSDRTIRQGKIGQQRSEPFLERALAGEEGREINPGTGGKVRLRSYLPLAIPGLNWAVVGTIDLDEVEEPIWDLQQISLILGSILASLVVGAAIFFARTLSRPLLAMHEAARKIAGGDLSVRVQVAGNDELGQLAVSFNQMAVSNEAQLWVKSSLAVLSGMLQTAESPEQFAGNLIRKLTPLLGCGHGVFYIRDEEQQYRLLGSYGYNDRKNLNHVFSLGKGLVGQCALEKETIVLTGVPGDHVQISTGLGESAPLTIMALPLVFQDEVLAVIELASFHPFTPAQRTLLQELSSLLGLGLENLNRNQRTVMLLQQTQRQAEELEMQGEEMRQANEELQLQSEKIRLANETLQNRHDEVSRANEELEEQSHSLLRNQEELRAQQSALEQANEALETARQEVERKAADLAAASHYKSQFLANMSHELRTPLNSLLLLAKGFADNEEGNLTPEQLESARIILGSGTDLLELINDILDLSKIEAGKMDLSISQVDVVDFAQAVRTQFKHMAAAKGLAWEVTVAEGVPGQIETDAAKVRQIVKNFLSNAFKFTEKGLVAVRFGTSAAGWLTIAVADTGLGIPAGKHQLIFEAFQQADGSTSRQFGGTGLGLSIVRELAKLLHAEIHMASEEGKGSVFSLHLPARFDRSTRPADVMIRHLPSAAVLSVAHRADVQHVAASAHALNTSVDVFIEDDRDAISQGDRLLLVIEDDPNFASIVRNQARKQGFKCLAAGGGETGVRMAMQFQPMGIILDHALPDMDGQQVMARLRQHPTTAKIPVHIISAMDRHQSLGQGAIGVLEKPVTREQLNKVMEMFACHGKERQSRLLLVEDDANSRRVTVKLLEGDGIQVVTAVNCQEALQRLRDEPFDCMILDLSLPDCSGFKLLESISRDPTIRELPVVIHSGKELSREEYRQLRQYTHAVVTKGTSGSGERLAREVGAFLQTMAHAPLPESPGEAMQDWVAVFKNRSVLLVDDDVRNTFALSRALEKRGVHVIMAPDGQTALELLEHSPGTVEAVLMDVMMPGLDGHEVTRRIRQKVSHHSLPIIGLSAKAMAEDRHRALEAGMDHFLPKPVDLEHLLPLLQRVMAGERGDVS